MISEVPQLRRVTDNAGNFARPNKTIDSARNVNCTLRRSQIRLGDVGFSTMP